MSICKKLCIFLTMFRSLPGYGGDVLSGSGESGMAAACHALQARKACTWTYVGFPTWSGSLHDVQFRVLEGWVGCHAFRVTVGPALNRQGFVADQAATGLRLGVTATSQHLQHMSP